MGIENEDEGSESGVDNRTADLAASWDESDSTEEELAPETPLEGEEEPETPPEDVQAAAEGEIGGGGDTGTGELDFAPKSLSAAAREAWRETPAAMKAEIAKREQDYTQGIQKYAEGAKRAEGMDRALAPYQQYFQMNGGAGPSIQGLLQTGSGLQMGSPIQKAQIIGNLIKQFGVDISTLDGLLSGQGVSPQVQQQNDVQQQVSAALQPYQQHMAQLQQQQQYEQQQQQGQVHGELNAFSAAPENEFYGDVKMQMADILDLAANRGQNMGLKEAYTTACQLNPEIAKIVQTRTQAAGVQSRRRAASSISGTPGGPGDSSPANSMRGAIEDAWDNVGRM